MSAGFMDSHMNFRMTTKDKKLIESAARLRGLKPNTYARQKLLESAEKDLAELSQSNTLILSEEDWKLFLAIMEAPIRTNENLLNAFRQLDKFGRCLAQIACGEKEGEGAGISEALRV